MLRHKFWQSLSSEKLKSQTRHKYDTVFNYDKLLREIRMVEKQLVITPGQPELSKHSEKVKSAHHHPVVYQSDLLDLEKRLDMKLEKIGKNLDSKIDDKFDQILSRLDSSNNTGQNRAYNQEGANARYPYPNNEYPSGNSKSHQHNGNKGYNDVAKSSGFPNNGYDPGNRRGGGRGNRRGGHYNQRGRGDLNF